MTPTVSKNADGSINLTMDPVHALACAAALHDANLEVGLPVLAALIGSPKWLQGGGEGIVGREAYDAFRAAQGLVAVP